MIEKTRIKQKARVFHVERGDIVQVGQKRYKVQVRQDGRVELKRIYRLVKP